MDQVLPCSCGFDDVSFPHVCKTLVTTNKIEVQIHHVLNTHRGAELRQKLYELVMEWYLKGTKTGLQYDQKELFYNE
jgi:hypothetical protein